MALTDWSQSGEEAMILPWAVRHGQGRWLDIGAADGSSASNTHALALEGWPGVAVEPAAGYFAHLANLYADRPDVECVQAAVVTEPAPLVRFYLSDDLVSTTDEAHVKTWGKIATFNALYVGAVTVAELLSCFPGPYDFASIDTEGTSVELWDELRRLDAFAPGALAVIEAEDGGERWQIQRACLDGWARVGVTPNNVLLERL